jgi:hypothetical protein
LDFFADLDQMAFQYDRIAEEERAKAETGEHACPDYWGGVAAGVRLAAAQVQKLQKAAVKSTLPPEVAAYWDAVDQSKIQNKF